MLCSGSVCIGLTTAACGACRYNTYVAHYKEVDCAFPTQASPQLHDSDGGVLSQFPQTFVQSVLSGTAVLTEQAIAAYAICDVLQVSDRFMSRFGCSMALTCFSAGMFTPMSAAIR